MWRILAVDDDSRYRAVLKADLEQSGHTVFDCGSGADALELSRDKQPDVVLLNLALPDATGAAICRCIKARPRHCPIMIVSGNNDEESLVAAYEAGADDFLLKPFSFRELLLRIRVLIERVPCRKAGPLVVGDLILDFDACRVIIDERRRDLSKAELAFLRSVCTEPGESGTRDRLLDAIWGIDADFKDVNNLVRRVREKLGPYADCIETVRGVGYRFSAPQVEGAAAPSGLLPER